MRNIISITLVILNITRLCSCKKYLDEIPDKSLAIPSTFKQLQALLDQDYINNIYLLRLGDAGADDYYLTKQDWEGLYLAGDRNSYIWGDELFYNQNPNTWAQLYEAVYYANIILEYVDKVEPDGDEVMRNKIKAAALFFRSRAFFTALTYWAKAYDASTASTDPGVPLRLVSDFNLPSERASVEKCYEQIINDLILSISLFPNLTEHVMRPQKSAAMGFLARVYLNKGDYQNALKYADSCLSIKNDLLDYNDLDASIYYPITQFNDEVLFSASGYWGTLFDYIAKVDTVLYNSYDENDLRKDIFFISNGNGAHVFRGSYENGMGLFYGIATDEVYLIKSEAAIRLNNVEEGLETLNSLLKKRFKTNTYVDLSGLSQQNALNVVINERRKELLMRDLRWQDLKRINKDPLLEPITVRRDLDATIYELEPNDNRYALPIPQVVINESKIAQNPR